jgi:hypothetical protein
MEIFLAGGEKAGEFWTGLTRFTGLGTRGIRQ